MPDNELLSYLSESWNFIIHADAVGDDICSIGTIILKVTRRNIGDDAEAGEQKERKKEEKAHVAEVEKR